VIIDAIVLAGGRATRLGGTSKAAISLDGRSLLEHTLESLSRARRIVVVGDEADILRAAPGANILIAREYPIFAGPAAAIAAGVSALETDTASDFTVVLACDMPAVGGAIDALLAVVQNHTTGVVAVSGDGRAQPLVGAYSTPELAKCVARHRDDGDLANLSVRVLLSGLDATLVRVPEGATDDVDTWADADRLGVLASQPQHERE
jgi:molybdopterin-guanine dinucleotide biosynthesis protein A